MSDEESPPSPPPVSEPPASEPPPESPRPGFDRAPASPETRRPKSDPPMDRRESSAPPYEREGRERGSRRRRLEGVIPEIVRRAVEIGVEKAQEAPDNIKQF